MMTGKTVRKAIRLQQSGKVDRWLAEVYAGTVYGDNDSYDVVLYMNNGRLERASCTCPSQGGCSHELALLIQLREEGLCPGSE